MGRVKKDVEDVIAKNTGKTVTVVEKWSKEELAEIAEENAALVGQTGFSDRQMRFLENYLSDDECFHFDLGKSIAAAGYRSKSSSARSTLGRMILNKYESSTEHVEIMRKMGFGEAWIISRLAYLAVHAKAESVQYNALNTLSKCIGMQKDPGEVGGGTEINIFPTEKLPARAAEPQRVEIEISASPD